MWGGLLFYCRIGMTALALKEKIIMHECECLDEIFVTALTHLSLSLISPNHDIPSVFKLKQNFAKNTFLQLYDTKATNIKAVFSEVWWS